MNSKSYGIQRLDHFQSNLSLRNKFIRLAWSFVWFFLFRPSPRTAFRWRLALLKLFGTQAPWSARVYRSAVTFLPSNLTMGEYVVVGPDVDLYCVAPINIGDHVMISQRSFLCAATHDHREPDLPLIAKEIAIGRESWVCAQAIIGPGVKVGHCAVIGAGAVTFRDVEPGVIVAGNPAKVVGKRHSNKSIG